MILKKEIEKKAWEQGVSRSTVDKDWALGHFVDAIFSVARCRQQLVFKGGTCLRKCYFPDYRFSEDLDFTSIDPGFVLDEGLLHEIMALIRERTGMPLHLDRLTRLRHKDRPAGYAAVVKFWGADHARDQNPPEPSRWTSSIKIELITYEKLVFDPVSKNLYHDYSDTLSSAADDTPCYDLREVLSEKLRALLQRSYTAPRDYYDIWYLSTHVAALDWDEIKDAFYRKMEFKALEFTGVGQLINPKSENTVRHAWATSLGHQITAQNLPAFGKVRDELESLFHKIFETV